MSDAKTCKKTREFFAIEGRAIVTHNFIQGAFYWKQLLEVVPQIGHAHGLGLKDKWKLAKVITNQNI